MTKTTAYDVIIIGAGHNGLVCATYLAKAGKKVLVLEASDQVGGMARSETIFDNYKISALPYVTNIDPDVEKTFGLKDIAVSDVTTCNISAQNGALTYTNQEITGNISEDDQVAYADFTKEVKAYTRALRPLLLSAPINLFNLDWGDKKTAFKLAWKMRFGLGKDQMRELLRVIGMNIYDWLDEKFKSPELKGALAFDACVTHNHAPRSSGSVFTFLYAHAMGQNRKQIIGGNGELTEHMHQTAVQNGVAVETNSPVAKVTVENVKITGVTLKDGHTFEAPIIISNTDPKTTVFDLVGPRHFEADFVKGMDNIRMKGNTAKLHILVDGLPDFKGLDATNRLTITGTLRQVERAYDPTKYGEIHPKPIMEISIPTAADQSLAPSGHHIISTTVQYVPYDLKGGWTDNAKMTLKKSCIDRIAEFAPDIHSKIIESVFWSPKDIEERYNIHGGDWHHGAMALDQLMMLRPTPRASRYALPLDGLYLCGAGAHPGGGIMGTAGRLCAEQVLKDIKKGKHDD